MANVVTTTLRSFVDGIVTALPDILTGLVFLALAFVVIRVVTWVTGVVAARAFGDEEIYVRLVRLVVAIFLWFGALLTFLTVVGLGDIAASLGTASGFLALGVSYALSGMLADVVAGIYLIRDPDFELGDHVVAGDTDGVVEAIELRKTRFDVGEDTVVRANAEVEKKWTKKSE
ncbi:mechanosensitive ion channel domain-containing protein [Halocalculus aciditolerans]|uniref:Mechanosensitive ion channel MscS domain-containing protein n=1 Tax=Halocalculus aciditolerans TaxID=1383812 RepID=A0A830FGG6_9EURY|nr:mechanosensitive ion channel domain-containing protein [Halocalculus aciditolerans]GGL52953.1 hypothetical protein GCM10009039_08950 [Halocalculus aciditolerans]